MSYYRFKIKQNNEFDNFTEIIYADKEAKHFVKHRTYSPRFVDEDEDIYSSFKSKKNSHKNSTYYNLVLLFCGISLSMIAITILIFININPKELINGIAIPITTLFFTACFVLLLSFYIIDRKFVNLINELFIVYNKNNNVCSVETKKNKIKVLYKNKLYIIKSNKIKIIDKGKNLYLAYLNMLPISVLRIDNYNIEFEKSNYIYTLTPKIKYLQNGTSTLSICCPRPIFNLERIQEGEKVFIPKPQYIQFSKYIFVLNSELKLNSIYYAATDNRISSYYVLTHAQLNAVGNNAILNLKKLANENAQLKEILKDII